MFSENEINMHVADSDMKRRIW